MRRSIPLCGNIVTIKCDRCWAELTLATLQEPATGAALLACNLDARFVQEYATGWWQKDVWAIGAMPHPRGRAFIVSDIVPDAQWTRSEIFNELVKPLADCRHCIGAIVDVGGSLGVMGFHRPSMASNFLPADRRRLQGLVPHIQRALLIGQELERQEVNRRTGLAALDGLSFGLIVVDAQARPLLANAKAESYLRPGGGLLGGSSGRALRWKASARPPSSTAWCKRRRHPGPARRVRYGFRAVRRRDRWHC